MPVFDELAESTNTLADTVIPDATTASTEGLPTVVPDEFCLGGDTIRSLYRQIAAVAAGSDCDDSDLKPSVRALEVGFEVVEKTAYALMQDQRDVPRGCVTTDGLGGLRIEWWSGDDRVVVLAIGADENRASYVFSSYGRNDEGRTERRVLPLRLAERLKKLTEQDA